MFPSVHSILHTGQCSASVRLSVRPLCATYATAVLGCS